MPASSLVTSLAILTLPLYRLWNTTGFVMLLGIIVAGWLAAVLDATVAYLSLRNPQLRVSAPHVSVVDEPCRIEITDASPVGAVVKLNSAVSGTSDNSARVGQRTSLIVYFDRRSTHLVLPGEMVVVGPLGIVSCRRRFHVVPLGGVAVGPLPSSVAALPELPSDEEATECHVVSRGSDLTRSVRPYRRGDAQSLVAWKASARSGELMVRELEGTVDQEVVLAVQVAKTPSASARTRKRLVNEPDALSEQAIGRAAGYAIDALRQGRTVRLITNEQQAAPSGASSPPRFGANKPVPPSGPVVVRDAPVRNETEVIARLAAVRAGEDLRRRPELLERSGPAVFFVGPGGDHVVGGDVST